MSEWTIRHLRTFEQFDSLASEWDTLLAATQTENIFLTHGWLNEWWRVYGGRRELWTLVASSAGGRVDGIAPLVLERDRHGTRRLVLMGTGEVAPNHLDLIAQEGRQTELLRSFVAYLLQNRAQWDLLELDTLPQLSPTRELLIDLLRRHGLAVRAEVSSRCPYAVLPCSFEAYLQSRGRKTRAQLRYSRNRLKRQVPEARFIRVETPQAFEPAFDALVRLHQARWTQRGQAGSFSTPEFKTFHRAAARAALASGALRLYALQIGDAFAAIYYCFRVGSHVIYYNAGFDEAWGRHSVGMQTLAYAIEQSIAEGAAEFDFIQGDEPYKTHWATHTRDNWRVCAASPHLRGRLAWWRIQATENARAWSHRYLSRETRRTLKRLLRQA